MEYRYYPNKYPSIGDLVVCLVSSINETSVMVKLVEYDCLDAMISKGDLSRKRIHSISRITRIGKTEVAIVTMVDEQKGYIDLSKRDVKPNEIEQTLQKYEETKKAHLVMKSLANEFSINVGDVYEQFGWKIYHGYENLHNAFTEHINTNVDIFSEVGIDVGVEIEEKYRESLMKHIKNYYKLQKTKLTVTIRIFCGSIEGIEGIKQSVRVAKEKYPHISIVYGGAGYDIRVDTMDVVTSSKEIEDFINIISVEIKKYENSFVERESESINIFHHENIMDEILE